MTFIAKPKASHPATPKNALGLTRRDYEGGLSTLCAGCGHDSITAAIVQAFFDLAIPPHLVAKMSGIGCSSKTPGYFLAQAHGFNAVHGRMPSVTTGANAAHKDLKYIAVSGDGDTGSIGIGQYIHAMRRNINMLYIIENNGVYGLTKGQFSALAETDATNKKGETNPYGSLDPVELAMVSGAGFVARSFSGDKDQLVPLIKAGIEYPGFALIDVISPCVTFNNHSSSTKGYSYAREHNEIANTIDLITPEEEITISMPINSSQVVELHGGERICLHKKADHNPIEHPIEAMMSISKYKSLGKILTGLLYLRRPDASQDHCGILNISSQPLRDLDQNILCPGEKAMAEINRLHQ